MLNRINQLLRSQYDTKYVCLNIAKTAGTSLSQLLMDTYKKKEVYSSYGKAATYDRLGHLQADYFLEFLTKLRPRHIRRAKIFTGHLPFIDKKCYQFPIEYILFLRNPIERIISGYTYGMRHQNIPLDFFDYGLHMSCSFEHSTNFSNPILQTLLHKTKINTNDADKIDGLIQSIGFIGITEAFEYSTQQLLQYLGKSSNKSYYLNTSNKIKIPHAATIRTIQYRNYYDILLYNKACESLNSKRLAEGLDPIPLCDYQQEGPFSSGDYHPTLSCYQAFNHEDDSAWFPNAFLLATPNEYIGYDFGVNQQRIVRELQLQVLGPDPSIAHYALEASNDGFVHDVQMLMSFNVPISLDNLVHHIPTGITYSARMWRIRRLSDLNNSPLAIATLSFTPEQKAVCKNAALIQANISELSMKFNHETYSRALSDSSC